MKLRKGTDRPPRGALLALWERVHDERADHGKPASRRALWPEPKVFVARCGHSRAFAPVLLAIPTSQPPAVTEGRFGGQPVERPVERPVEPSAERPVEQRAERPEGRPGRLILL